MADTIGDVFISRIWLIRDAPFNPLIIYWVKEESKHFAATMLQHIVGHYALSTLFGIGRNR